MVANRWIVFVFSIVLSTEEPWFWVKENCIVSLVVELTEWLNLPYKSRNRSKTRDHVRIYFKILFEIFRMKCISLKIYSYIELNLTSHKFCRNDFDTIYCIVIFSFFLPVCVEHCFSVPFNITRFHANKSC